MILSNQNYSIPAQKAFWNNWNEVNRDIDEERDDVANRQSEVILNWLESLGRHNLEILEVGCGSGWLCPRLAVYGNVTGTDLSEKCLARAQVQYPHVKYVPGDFMTLDFGNAVFDVIVTLDVLAHVADQKRFIEKIASHVAPGGHLMIATQNAYVLRKFNRIPPPAAGQLRRWVDREELRELLQSRFDVQTMLSVLPRANRGVMRAVNSYKVNWVIRKLIGNRFDLFKESIGLGWTLMALAQKS